MTTNQHMIKFDNDSIIQLSRNHLLSYEVNFVKELLNPINQSKLKELCINQKILLVIDKNVFDLYQATIESYFQQNCRNYTIYLFEALEEKKTIESVLEICYVAQEFKMKRDSIFIGIGGGVTLDVLGFAAFIFRRKTRYIRIPTTLVGLVDAGVGVKVGINFNNAKNLLGGYYAPIASFNDKTFLRTIDITNIKNGLYEIVKMGLISNKKLFRLTQKYHKDFLEKNFNEYTDKVVYLSALSMMKELEPNLDEHELKRSVDFGHTFSTYIEEFSNYTINHGEAVGLDVLISSFIALKRGIFSKNEFNQVFELISSIGFSKKYKLPSLIRFHKSLELVRNHRAGNLNLVLPSRIGSCVFTNDCSIVELKSAVNFCKDLIY